MPRTPVYIVCSPRPGVGKTLLARLAAEFLLLSRGAATAFDISLRDPSLVDYLPHLTETAAIDDTFGKMALMDRLIVNDGLPKVIDLGFHAFDEFFRMCREIGFVKEGERGGIEPVILFLADHHRASVQSWRDLRTAFPTTAIVPVDNEHVLQGELPPGFAPPHMLRIAALPPFLRTYIDRLSFSFTDYLRRSDHSSELHQWTRRNYTALREVRFNLRQYRA
ncbi:MAG: hypothetical protein WBA66_09555 [Xanthobacteraceae bacterium]